MLYFYFPPKKQQTQKKRRCSLLGKYIKTFILRQIQLCDEWAGSHFHLGEQCELISLSKEKKHGSGVILTNNLVIRTIVLRYELKPLTMMFLVCFFVNAYVLFFVFLFCFCFLLIVPLRNICIQISNI